MDRSELLSHMDEVPVWDVLVIGGGATGLGVGVDSTTRGYRTLLLEQHDFCKGTSSKSTKLIHGGVRYLAQGHLGLVHSALRERGILLRNAPRLVKSLPMVIPAYRLGQLPFYGIGLKLYDLLAGRLRLGKTRLLSAREVEEQIPTIRSAGLQGGLLFFDAQFDDTRLGISLVQAMARGGGVPINYCAVEALRPDREGGYRADVRDSLTGQVREVRTRVVVNATGAYTDRIRRMVDREIPARIKASRGSHVVLDSSFLPGKSALLVPRTDDGRVLFAIPWNGRVVAGTTDVPDESASLEPKPGRDELEFILRHLGRYLTAVPRPEHVLSMFSGLRPLVGGSNFGAPTSGLSRDHVLEVLDGRVVSVMGGKWTTYRKMAEDAVDLAAKAGELPWSRSRTASLQLNGTDSTAEGGTDGSLERELKSLVDSNPKLGRLLHPRLPYTEGMVVWSVRKEWAQTLEDVLARRTRSLLLDARASIEAAASVARLMAGELDRDLEWQNRQVAEYLELARLYLPD